MSATENKFKTIDRAYPRVYEALRIHYTREEAVRILFDYSRLKRVGEEIIIARSVSLARQIMREYHGRLGGRG